MRPSLNRLANMVDAVGTTVYTYDFVGQLLSEDGPWADDTVNYTYANRLRTSLSVNAPNASPWAQSYEYDPLDRLTNVTSAAGTFEYYYGVNSSSVMLPGSLIQSLNLPNGAYITNTFDGNARLTETALQNSSGANIDAETYVYNQGNQRTEQTFTAGNYMNYTYDGIGELQTALGKEPGGVTNRLHEQFGYAYDAAGNLNQRTNNGLDTFFGVNNLNELRTVTHSGTLTAEGTTTSPATNVTVNTSNAVLYVDNTFASTNQPLVNSQTNIFTAVAQDSYGRVSTNISQAYFTLHEMPSYDLNGNLLSETTPLGRQFAYDDENQLIAVWVTNTWMSQFVYDGFGRRRIRREYAWAGSWSLASETHYIYDGMEVIQERDGNNNVKVTYTRGLDLSVSFQGVGGIGGLLARTDGNGSAYYHSDGAGNITAMVNSGGTVQAKYLYDPYGNLLNKSGPLADVNLYRFSSKEVHPNSGLYYYGFRYYQPNLQRWMNQDPIQENGGLNLYDYVGNNPINRLDPLGLAWYSGIAALVGLGGPGEFSAAWSGFGESWSDSSVSIWNAMKAKNWNEMADAYDGGVLDQTKDADPVTKYGTRAAIGTATVCTAAATTLIGLEVTGVSDIGETQIGWRGGEITFTPPGSNTPDFRINPFGDWDSSNSDARWPHYHRRPGIGRHRPWEGW